MRAIVYFVLCAILPALVQAENPLDNILSDLRTGKIAHIDCYFISYNVSTFIKIDKSVMQSLVEPTRLDIGEVDVNGLMTSIKDSKFEFCENPPDVRSGLIFVSRSGEEVHSILLSGRSWFGDGRKAVIDGRPMEINSKIQKWIEPWRKKIGDRMRTTVNPARLSVPKN